jgi:hypothetical protein
VSGTSRTRLRRLRAAMPTTGASAALVGATHVTAGATVGRLPAASTAGPPSAQRITIIFLSAAGLSFQSARPSLTSSKVPPGIYLPYRRFSSKAAQESSLPL